MVTERIDSYKAFENMLMFKAMLKEAKTQLVDLENISEIAYKAMRRMESAPAGEYSEAEETALYDAYDKASEAAEKADDKVWLLQEVVDALAMLDDRLSTLESNHGF